MNLITPRFRASIFLLGLLVSTFSLNAQIFEDLSTVYERSESHIDFSSRKTHALQGQPKVIKIDAEGYTTDDGTWQHFKVLEKYQAVR